MAWHITPYVVALFFTAGVSALVAVMVWGRRPLAGTTSLAILLVAVAEWALATGLDWAAVGTEAKVFFSKIEYLGLTTAPPLFLLFALEYTRQEQRLARRNVSLLMLFPFLTTLLAATNEKHNLIWTSFTPSPVADSNLLVFGHGTWFWLLVVYSYMCLLAGAASLVKAAIRSRHLYQRQAVAIVLASLAPWLGNIAYVFDLMPIPGLDLTPVVFSLSGLILTWGILGFGMFDLVPVARETLIEKMGDAVLVLDEQNRIVDMNPAAGTLLGVVPVSVVAQFADDALAAWPDLIGKLSGVWEGQAETLLPKPTPMHFDVRISPLSDRRRRFGGRLVVLRDITERKKGELEIHRLNQLLQAQLAEIEALQASLREQAIRDPLTGLFNRRYLEETLERELARAERQGQPVGIIMMDIDHFKSTNDTFGHEAGDLMLRVLGDMLLAESRRGDIACRYGGEEFLVILPGASLDTARRRAEQWRADFETLRVAYSGSALQGTLSLGVVAFPHHGRTRDDLLRAVDKALYAAKSAGRNCVVVGGG